MIASKMSAMGLWPGAFSDITKATAAGSTLATAGAAAVADIVMIVAGTGNVALDSHGSPGDEMTIINATGAAVGVYTLNGKGTINGTANPYSMVAAHCAVLKCLKAGTWFVLSDVALTGTIPTGAEEEPAAAEAPPA